MIGCGEIPDIRFLKYLEGSLTDDPDAVKSIEDHLTGCDVCLNELLELNRLNTLMDGAETVPVQRPQFIKAEFLNGLWKRVGLSGGSYYIEEKAAVRGNEGAPVLQLKMSQNSLQVNIIPVETGVFWVKLQGGSLKDKVLELRSQDKSLIYSVTSKEPELVLKGLNYGVYEIRIGEEKVHLLIGKGETL